ncbi:MAG: SRPBCC family protein [Candidatus Omnitrophica bacterium]|nr:SRPBCC family protein [Candidatus Omnitrophota bacterium]
MKEIVLCAKWFVRAPLEKVFQVMTDFEKYPEHFPKVAESIRIIERKGDCLQMEATVKSFGSKFPVKMRTRILSGKGFISDNESLKFGVSGHEEFLLSENQEGTMVDYTYQVSIHKPWLRIIAKPLLGWYSMRHWEKAIIDELKRLVER